MDTVTRLAYSQHWPEYVHTGWKVHSKAHTGGQWLDSCHQILNQRDQGVYVCQVSTSTGSLSHYYNLAIIVPRAYILGADEYYAMAGGDISLVCIIEDTLEPPQYVYWYHNDKIINYDTKRTRVSFDLGDKTLHLHDGTPTTTSQSLLLFAMAISGILIVKVIL